MNSTNRFFAFHRQIKGMDLPYTEQNRKNALLVIAGCIVILAGTVSMHWRSLHWVDAICISSSSAIIGIGSVIGSAGILVEVGTGFGGSMFSRFDSDAWSEDVEEPTWRWGDFAFGEWEMEPGDSLEGDFLIVVPWWFIGLTALLIFLAITGRRSLKERWLTQS